MRGVRRVGWLLAVVGVVVALTAGWPLVSLAVSGNQPVTAGETLLVGSGSAAVAFSPGAGWVIHTATSDPAQGWSLERGPVHVTVTYTMLLGPAQATRLWPGLRSTLRLGGGAPELGRAGPLPRTDGLARRYALTGSVSDGGVAGQAVIIPDPDEDFAVEVIGVAPANDAAAARAAALRVAGALHFPQDAA